MTELKSVYRSKKGLRLSPIRAARQMLEILAGYFVLTIQEAATSSPNGELVTGTRVPSAALMPNAAILLVATLLTYRKVFVASTMRNPGCVTATVPVPWVVKGDPATWVRTPEADLKADTLLEPEFET